MFEYLTGNSTGPDTDLSMDCSDLFNRGERNSGVYSVKPNLSEPFNVYCELTSGKTQSRLKFSTNYVTVMCQTISLHYIQALAVDVTLQKHRPQIKSVGGK